MSWEGCRGRGGGEQQRTGAEPPYPRRRGKTAAAGHESFVPHESFLVARPSRLLAHSERIVAFGDGGVSRGLILPLFFGRKYDIIYLYLEKDF